MKNNLKISIVFLVLGLLYNINTLKAEVLLKDMTSALILYQKDSVFEAKYLEASKFFGEKKYPEALRLGIDLLDYSVERNNKEMISKSNYLIGNIFFKTRVYRRSLNYLKKSLEQFNELTSSKPINDASYLTKDKKYKYLYYENLLRIGSAYQKLIEIDTLNSKFYRDSTFNSYNKILDEITIDKKILDIKAKAYINLSVIEINQGDFAKGKLYIEDAVDIHSKRGKKVDQAAALGNLGSVYLLEGDFENSKLIYFEAIELIKNNNSSNAVSYKASLYANLAWAMRNLEDYKAYDYQELSYEIKDEIRDTQLRSSLETIAAQNDVETAKKITRKEAQIVTWIIGLSSFFVIVLLVFFLNQYKLRQKNLGLELSRQELMQQQKIEKIKSESQIRILNATIDGKEKERKQIAETLHDSVSALLSSANLHLQACKKQFNGSTPIEVDKSQSIINEASQKIRDLSHTLVSSILLKFGLSYAIKDIAEKYSNSQLHIDYDTRYIQRYDQRFEIKLYNIIQEFVNNILKHSDATHASITLVEKNKKLKLIIKDNGKGFDKELIPEKDGLGINQIDARIQMMQGKFHIESGKGKGTLINIELPVFEKEPVKFA